MVRTGNKATRAGKRVSGAGRTSKKESDGIGESRESTIATARIAELALLAGRGSLPNTKVSNQSPQGEQRGTKGNGFSQALAWTAEPEWEGESSEEASETAGGSREPESCAD